MKKIKIRDTSSVTSVANVIFSIEKGQIVSVPDNFKVDESIFKLVEDSEGKPIADDRVMSDMEAKRLLEISNFSNFTQKVEALDLNTENLTKLRLFEKAGKKRKEWMTYFLTIMEPEDTGEQITDEGMLTREIMSVKGINDMLARDIVEKYKTREEIVKRLSNNKNDIEALKGMTHEIVEALLNHFKIVKSKVTTKKTMFGG